MIPWRKVVLAVAMLVAPMTAAAEDMVAAGLAERLCGTLAGRVAAEPGGGPLFLRSYDGAAGAGPDAEPALAGAAFTYDNALAVIALTACGRLPEATRIGAALLAAAQADRSGEPGRLRNAYRAGPQQDLPVPPMGWWDAAAGRWAEDPYQVGIATGNVAWAALALLTLHRASGDNRFLAGVPPLLDWVERHARRANGYSGGLHGYDDAPVPLTWTSTEHNTDLAAVFAWAARVDPRRDWSERERHARGAVAALWQADQGRFAVGTLPDGRTVNQALSGLDAQLWPQLLPRASGEWRRALDYVERAHGVAGGFDFNDDRDGLWLEGTAQAALVYRRLGQSEKARRLLDEVAAEVSPGGQVWATRQASISTGLAIGPDSTTDDFRYYRRPHLGATAWAVLAALGWNPFDP